MKPSSEKKRRDAARRAAEELRRDERIRRRLAKEKLQQGVHFAVMAETFEGVAMALRDSFVTREEAEAHPVEASAWKRVWIEERKPKRKEPDGAPAPLPWTVDEGHQFVLDADGGKVAALLGGKERRRLAAEALTALVAGGAKPRKGPVRPKAGKTAKADKASETAGAGADPSAEDLLT